MLNEKQMRQLEALRNRATLYEAAITRPDGTKVLLAYCDRRSRVGLAAALKGRWEDSWKFMELPDDGEIRYPKKGVYFETSNGCMISFTGRTKRDVMMDNTPLPYVGANQEAVT